MGFFDDPDKLEVRTYRENTSPNCTEFSWVVHRPADCKDLASGTTFGSEQLAKREAERARDRILEKRRRRHGKNT